MRETSYHAVIAEMTVRALWELQNLLDCIPDALWDRCYGGAPLWQHVYHTLHELDQWFINPRDTDFVEPPIHTPHLQELHIYPAVRLDRPAIDDYFYTIKAKLSIYLTSLHDEDLLQRPDNCEWTRFTLILSQYRHLYRHMGMVMGFIEAETGLCPRTLEVGEDLPAAPYPEVPDRLQAPTAPRSENYYPNWSRTTHLDAHYVRGLTLENLHFITLHSDERPKMLTEGPTVML